MNRRPGSVNGENLGSVQTITIRTPPDSLISPNLAPPDNSVSTKDPSDLAANADTPKPGGLARRSEHPAISIWSVCIRGLKHIGMHESVRDDLTIICKRYDPTLPRGLTRGYLSQLAHST